MKNKEAIEILKTESCADCSCHPESPMSCINTKCPLVEATLLAIKALEAQGWIPVSERLPDDRKDTYWVCTISGYQCQCRWTNVNPFWTNLETDWHWCHFDIPQYQEVIAWMPLPEPYTKEDDT